jgi:hypothetical protein
MLNMDLEIFLKFVFIFVIIPNAEMPLKKMSFIKESYNVFHTKRCPLPSLSLSLSHILVFLNEIMKNQVLNKIVCSMMESYFFIPKFFSLLFGLPPNSRGTPADPSRHTSVPRHTG